MREDSVSKFRQHVAGITCHMLFGDVIKLVRENPTCKGQRKNFERDIRATELRYAGLTYLAIAKKCGYRSPSRVRQVIHEIMRKMMYVVRQHQTGPNDE